MDFWSMNNTKRNTFQIHYLFSDRVFWKLRITELKSSDWGSGFFLARGDSSRVSTWRNFQRSAWLILSQIHDPLSWLTQELKITQKSKSKFAQLDPPTQQQQAANDYSGGSWLKQVLTRPTLSSHRDICHSFLEEWEREMAPP